jgi:hypothetical protein
MTGDDRWDRLAGELERIAEELAELAYDRLREAVHNGHPDAAALNDEKRLQRARRAVDKAATELRGRPRS